MSDRVSMPRLRYNLLVSRRGNIPCHVVFIPFFIKKYVILRRTDEILFIAKDDSILYCRSARSFLMTNQRCYLVANFRDLLLLLG